MDNNLFALLRDYVEGIKDSELYLSDFLKEHYQELKLPKRIKLFLFDRENSSIDCEFIWEDNSVDYDIDYDRYSLIENELDLSDVYHLDEFDGKNWYERYLNYREDMKFCGFIEEPTTPDAWNFTIQDYNEFPELFTEVFSPLCNLSIWLQGNTV